MNYKKKYLKYKLKYLKLKKLSGGSSLNEDELWQIASNTDIDADKRTKRDAQDKENQKEIDFQIQSIREVINNDECKSEKEIEQHINEHLMVLQIEEMDEKSFEDLRKVLETKYNSEIIKNIIDNFYTVPETQGILEHRPQQSYSVRPRSPTLDRMKSMVPENEPENNSTCNKVCNIM